MNSPPRIQRFTVAISHQLLAFATLLALASAADSAVPGGDKPDPKTHTLFMGADLFIEQNQVLYRVQDVVGGSFVIKVDGKEVKIPADWGAIKLKVDRSLKLTDTSVSLDHLKAERAYTPGNDPVKKFMASQGQAMASQAATEIAEWNAVFSQRMANANAKAAAAGQEGGFPSGTDLNAAQRQLGAAYAAAQSDFGNNSAMVGKMQDELNQGLFDAMDVEFDVSSEKLIRQPYVVVMTQYRERESKPGESHNWIYAAALEPLDSRTQKVRIRKGGFPPGFVLENYQVHVYDGGQEVATNVSDKRVPLTRDEAFQYVLIDYVGSHKGASLPPTPAMGKLPADLRTRLDRGQLTQFFYIKVSKDGLPGEAYVDETCSRKVDDPFLLSVIRDLRFKPALEKGRPVEGTALLKFSNLRL